MAETTVKKFLDKGGVSTLWSRVAEELNKKATKEALNAVKTTADENAAKLLVHDSSIQANTNAIAVLNGDSSREGSVAYQIAQIVAGADTKFDTLKEIADWIANDTTGAASMASDIAALEELVGDTAVATQITNAINAALKTGETDKYALASDLTALATRVDTLEKAGYQNATQVGNAIDAKITALNLPTTYEAKGAAATAETNAKGYADGLFNNVQALTAEEISAAITAATTQVS